MTSTSDLRAQVRDAAKNLAHDAQASVQSTAEAHVQSIQDNAAAKVDELGHAADAAAGAFDPSSVQAQAVQQVADHIEGFAARLREGDLPTSIRGVSNFARQNPALFVAGAALAGFAATRFLKSRSSSVTSMGGGDPWGGESVFVGDQDGSHIYDR